MKFLTLVDTLRGRSGDPDTTSWSCDGSFISLNYFSTCWRLRGQLVWNDPPSDLVSLGYSPNPTSISRTKYPKLHVGTDYTYCTGESFRFQHSDNPSNYQTSSLYRFAVGPILNTEKCYYFCSFSCVTFYYTYRYTYSFIFFGSFLNASQSVRFL
jgi:hypothetical protein